MKNQDISENLAKIVYLGIGSNLGIRSENIEKAKFHLKENNIKFISISKYYETPSWPNPNYPKYLNIILKCKTNLSPFYLIKKLKDIEKKLGRKKNIKNFLLDQKIVSGIGNIYANEILYKSQISPMKSVRKLSKIELKKIIEFSKITLKDAIKYGGSSIKDFKSVSGGGGSFQTKFTVYNRENLNCTKSKCKGIIKKRYISNRSTFICNFCQT